MSETVIVMSPSSGTPAQPPAPPPAPLADVHAVLAELEAQKAPAAPAASAATTKGPEAAPDAPATPDPALPKSEPGKDAPQSTDAAPAAPAKVPYTKEEFAAFEGNYHRRDFDWDRWPEDMLHTREFIRKNASAYGRQFDQLQRERAEFEQLKAGQSPTPQPPATATPQTTDVELTPDQMADAQELLVTPGKFFEGAKILFGTKQGREVLSELGYVDPTERNVVSGLVQEKILTQAIANVAVDFPQYLEDPDYRKEVTAVIEDTPLLRAKVNSRDVDEVTYAFAVANASITAQRIGGRETSLSAREKALQQREAAVTTKEQELQRQIEATNRQEPTSPTVTPQASGSNAGLKPSSVDEARDVMRQVGMAT